MLISACLIALVFVFIFPPLIYPLRTLWAKTCFSLITAFGIDATISGVEIVVPAISTQYGFSFASPYTGSFLYLETLFTLILTSFFLIRSGLLKWFMFLISVPATIPVAVFPVVLTISIGLNISPDAGLFSYYRLLCVFTHLILLLGIVIFGIVAWRIKTFQTMRANAPKAC
jgi:hypothetical protein